MATLPSIGSKGARGALLLAAAQVACGAQAWELEGKVIRVEDGDTLTLLTVDHARETVRLSDIDAPETSHGRNRPGQPYSQVSKRSLAALAGGRQAVARCYERDRWQRQVCTVFVDGQDVSAEQLRRGMAWVNNANPRYVRDPRSFELQAQAQRAGVGLWAAGGPSPIPPWEWRRSCWAGQDKCPDSQ